MGFIKLMPHEHKFPINDLDPTAVVSFYTVNQPEDADAAISYISTRFMEILTANPWLCGRLVEMKVNGEKGGYLTYSDDVTTFDQHFNVTHDDKVFEFTELWPLVDHLGTRILKKGWKCIGVDERLCGLNVFHNTSKDRLAVMWVLNHSIGDGSTFYRLWKMLDMNQVVESMVVERFHQVDQVVAQKTNLQSMMGSSAHDVKMVCSLMGKGIKRTLCRNAPPNKFIYKVKSEEIAKRKSEYKRGEAFVSTNDILCTWLFSQCAPTNGMHMIVNTRERISELHPYMAGNYIFSCDMNFTDVETPMDFREKWTSIVAKERPGDSVKLSAGNMTANWLSLYHQVEVPHCTHLLHLPIPPHWEVWMGIPLAYEAFLIPFRLHNDAVGVVIGTYSDVLTEEYFESCDLLEKISLNL